MIGRILWAIGTAIIPDITWPKVWVNDRFGARIEEERTCKEKYYFEAMIKHFPSYLNDTSYKFKNIDQQLKE